MDTQNKIKKEIFISHSSVDNNLSQKMCESIEDAGYTCWIAPRDIAAGKFYAEEIIDGLDECEILLLIFSKSASQSPHVLLELERAVSKKLSIIVFRIDDTEIPKPFEYFLMANQWIDGRNLSELNFAQVHSALNASLGNKSQNEDITREEHMSVKVCKTSEPFKKIHLLFLSLLIVGIFLIVFFLSGIWDYLGSSSNTSDFATTSEYSQATSGSSTETGDKNGMDTPMVNDIPKVVGDKFELGSYNEESIIWTVIKVEEDGTLLALCDNIISVKAYDSAESGEWNYTLQGEKYNNSQRVNYTPRQMTEMMGSSDWETSNIRAWLNSSNREVNYIGQEPSGNALTDSRHSYEFEKGFLYDFTEQELSRIVTSKNKNILDCLNTDKSNGGTALLQFPNAEIEGNWAKGMLNGGIDLNGAYYNITQDKVFLLSYDEVAEYVYDKRYVEINVKITDKAGALTTEDYSQAAVSRGNTLYWYTRTPYAPNAADIIMITNREYEGFDFITSTPCAGAGVRPAVRVKYEDS